MDELRDEASGLTYFELLPRGERRGVAVVMHGRGVTKEDLVDLGEVLTGEGYVSLVPDAPMPWGGGRAWFDRESRSRDIPIARGMIASLLGGALRRSRDSRARSAGMSESPVPCAMKMDGAGSIFPDGASATER